MSAEKITSNSLKPGMRVIINPQTDKTRKVLVEGEIAEILTKSHTHPYGILVSLTSGEKGRVKDIASCATLSEMPLSIQKVDNIEDVIKNGEDHFCEFKTSMLWSTRLSDQELKNTCSREIKEYGRNTSKIIIAKTIAAFLNSDGGYLIIGIKENKQGDVDEIIGIESEYYKLNDKCEDGYRRMIIYSVIKPYFPSSVFNHINNYLHIRFHKINSKTVCSISIRESDVKVFLYINKKELFYIRVDASTRQLQGEQIVDYCIRRFIK